MSKIKTKEVLIIKVSSNKNIPSVLTFLSFIIFSFILMLFFTESSPLFYTNRWVDANSYYTVGKGMAEGLVPYKDLFEQKGPIVYFLHYLNYLVFPGSFHGIYIVESLFFAFNLCLIFKIYSYLLSKNWSYSLTIITAPFLIITPFFRNGDSAEELVFPAIFYMLLFIFRFFMDQGEVKKSESFMLGLAFAWTFWIKYTLIGGFIALCTGLFIVLLLQKRYKYLIQSVLMTLAGFFSLSGVIALSFYIKNGFKDLIDVYFLFNMGNYSMDAQMPFTWKVFNSFKIVYKEISTSPLVFSLIILGLILLFFSSKIKTSMALIVNFVFLTTVIVAFYGGKDYKYYFLILFPFVIFGILMLGSLVAKITKIEPKYILTVLALSLSFYLAFQNNLNYQQSKLYKNPKNQYEYIFKKEMEASGKSISLLNYGCLDLGMYKEMNVIPPTKYFHRNNVAYKKYPQLMDAQKEVVRNKKVNFLVIKLNAKEDIANLSKDEYNPKELLSNYKEIKRVEEGRSSYLLYQIKDK